MTREGTMHMMTSKVIIGCNYCGTLCWHVVPHVDVRHIPVWLRHDRSNQTFWFVQYAKHVSARRHV